MEYKLFKLKCRNCGCILDLSETEQICGCGNCSFITKNDRIYVGSKSGIGGYTLVHNNTEYLLLPKEDLEV